MILITESGMIVRSPVTEMRPMGRNTQGVRLINLEETDRVVDVAHLAIEVEDEA